MPTGRYLTVNGMRLTGQRFGVGRYLEYLLSNWTSLDGAFDGVRLLTPRGFDAPIELPPSIEHRVLPTRLPNAYWEQVVLARHHRPGDLLFCPSYVVPLAARGRVVVTHLGSYESLPSAFPVGERVKSRILYQLSARRADLVITVSESSKQDIVRHYGIAPDKIVVIPLGVDPRFRPLADPPRMASVRRELTGREEPFVLFVGKLTARRNIRSLVQAFARLKRELALPHSLVLIGANTAGHDLGALAAEHGLGDRLVHREYADHSALIEIYNAADLFVYPSSYEGFGIPVVEAMACGVPTITLHNSALSEFGDGVHYCPDGSAESLYDGMRTVMGSPELRRRLTADGRARAQDYLWGAIAARTMDALAGVAYTVN